MNWLKNFLKSHSISTHSLVAFTLLAVTAYYQVPQFHDYVTHVYGLLPGGVRNLIGAGIAVVAWYWRSQKQ